MRITADVRGYDIVRIRGAAGRAGPAGYAAGMTDKTKYQRLMAEHLAACDEAARTGVPFAFDLAGFEEIKAAFMATNPPRETFPRPFPLGITLHSTARDITTRHGT